MTRMDSDARSYSGLGAAYSRRRFLELAFGISVAGIIGCGPIGREKEGEKGSGSKRTLADVDPNSVARFVNGFEGKIVMPSDAHYEKLRRTWNFKFDMHPGMIAVCAGVDDVQRTVSFAAEHQLLLSVRSGGHSLAGYSSCDGGIVLVMSELQGVTVDPLTNRAELLGGTSIGTMDATLSQYGLASPGASAATVGYAGFATGSGRGTLSPRYGLACDNILAVEMVTADGQLRIVSTGSDPDLFWAVRGGGGNFGVVTRFTVQTHRVSNVVGGNLVFPFADASDILKRIRDLLEAVSEYLYVAPVLAGTPDGPLLLLNLMYCGPLEQAEATIAPYRAVGSAMADTLSELSYLGTQAWFPGPPLGTATEGCSGFFPVFTDEIIDALTAAATAGPAAFTIPCFSMHGAMADTQRDNNAYPLRMKGVDFFAMGFWTSPADRDRTEIWARELWSAVAAATQGTFVNGHFDGNSKPASISYNDKYRRLARIKADYDPYNLFSRNVNILPAG